MITILSLIDMSGLLWSDYLTFSGEVPMTTNQAVVELATLLADLIRGSRDNYSSTNAWQSAFAKAVHVFETIQ